jgi:hypothetical protein
MTEVAEGTAQVAKVNTLSAGIAIASITKQADTHLIVCLYVEYAQDILVAQKL